MSRITPLPDWFNWDDYAPLSNMQDNAKWAYLFAIRDSSYSDARAKGVSASRIVNPKTWKDGLSRLYWQDGVLFQGFKGHTTHDYLRSVVKHAAKDAEFIPEEKFQTLQKEGKLKKGSYYTSSSIIKYNQQQTGRLHFSDEEAFTKYRNIERSMFANTIELAINFHMDKDAILKEIKKIVTDVQNKLHGEPVRIKPIECVTSLNWARGLACWDLKQDNVKPASLARLLVPLWHNKNPDLSSGAANKNYMKEARDTVERVEPYINGGWKALTGDPLVTHETDLIQIKRG